MVKRAILIEAAKRGRAGLELSKSAQGLVDLALGLVSVSLTLVGQEGQARVQTGVQCSLVGRKRVVVTGGGQQAGPLDDQRLGLERRRCAARNELIDFLEDRALALGRSLEPRHVALAGGIVLGIGPIRQEIGVRNFLDARQLSRGVQVAAAFPGVNDGGADHDHRQRHQSSDRGLLPGRHDRDNSLPRMRPEIHELVGVLQFLDDLLMLDFCHGRGWA